MSDVETREDEMAAIVTGATTSSQPAQADDVILNRSGSGGTGGSALDDDAGEGSTGRTQEELTNSDGN